MLFLYNPTAGKGRVTADLAAVLDVFTKAGYLTTVYPTQGKADATRIAAADGTFELLRGETALYTGNTYTTSGRLTLNWSVRTPNPTLTYRLTVGDTELLLSLDPATECWILTKS